MPNTPLVKRSTFFVSPDTNGKQIRTERLGKKLLMAVQTAHPTLTAHLLRREAVVTVRWQHVAIVSCKDRDYEPDVLWDNEVVAKHQIDKPKALELFRKACELNTSRVSWSL